ncbi:MAG: hypothetical protein DRJ52_01900 [Thermoprotei archaeon]|nr:MAG: hypothetical protein DRJ52_01900 [Thermoprotei archaeon]RLE97888.1 MAG: hypothetical protein DRJ63_08480 [Thermoprotei archaeon]
MREVNRRHVIVALLAGIIVYLVFLLVINVNFGDVYRLIIGIDQRFLLIALFFDTNFIIFYGLAWYVLVKIVLREIKVKDALLAVIMGWLGDMIIPAAFVTGEVIRIIYLNKKYRFEYSKSLATVLVHRLLSAVAFVFFITFGAVFLTIERMAISRDVFREMVITAGLSGGFAAFLFFIFFKEEALDFVLSRSSKPLKGLLKRLKAEKYATSIDEGIVKFKKSLREIKRCKFLVLVGFGLLLVQWTAGILVPYCVFRALRSPVSFWVLSLAYPIYGVIDNIPVGIPVNAGILDTAMVSTFMLLGVSRDVAVAGTLITRTITVVYEAVLTGTISLSFGIREVWREYKESGLTAVVEAS